MANSQLNLVSIIENAQIVLGVEKVAFYMSISENNIRQLHIDYSKAYQSFNDSQVKAIQNLISIFSSRSQLQNLL